MTAGFWSKDEILADAWAHEYWFVFGTLALAALLTAFYTMRQITLTFLGEPRTEVAKHAHETPWTMTFPLIILAFFSVVYGWVGIPEDFLNLDFGVRNWFHDWVAGTLPVHLPAVHFSWVPLLTSLVVALGGLLAGWLTYRNFKVGQEDPLKKWLGPVYKVLQNKYYFDEIYDHHLHQTRYLDFGDRFLFVDGSQDHRWYSCTGLPASLSRLGLFSAIISMSPSSTDLVISLVKARKSWAIRFG